MYSGGVGVGVTCLQHSACGERAVTHTAAVSNDDFTIH